MVLRISGVVDDSIVDGPGLRMTVFTQGCFHNCPGCHNPATHDPCGGHDETTEALLARYVKNPLTRGVTFSGGEPFEQAEALAELGSNIRQKGGSVWTYTGYTFEYLVAHAGEHPGWRALLEVTDVLVDGRFELAGKSYDLVFRGSRNQRILDVPQSLAAGQAIWYPRYAPDTN